MGPGAGFLIPMMMIIYVIGYALIGLVFSLMIKGISRAVAPLSPIEGLQASAVKRGGIAGLIVALSYTAATFSDALIHTRISHFVPRLGFVALLFAFLPLALQCLDGHQKAKIAVALGLSLAPSLLFIAIGIAIGKH